MPHYNVESSSGRGVEPPPIPKKKRESRESRVDNAWDMIDQIAAIYSPNDKEAGKLLTERFGPDDKDVLANFTLISEELAEQKRMQDLRLTQGLKSSIGTLRTSLFDGPNHRHYAERKFTAPQSGHF